MRQQDGGSAVGGQVADPRVASDPLLHRVIADVRRTQGEVERFRGDSILDKQRLFAELEGGDPERRLICYLTGPGRGDINLADAAPIGSMLDASGECENLDLMLNSGGGSGEMAEKVIEMCRAHCRREFRVIVPNFAKSAATMIALGADVILMGYLSELGPIDPQYALLVGDIPQMVSGQSFLNAHDDLQQKVMEATAAGDSPIGYLQSLGTSTMEPAFLEHCRRAIDFSRDVTKKFLPKYQLRAKYGGRKISKRRMQALADEAAENLVSVSKRFSHGRLIGAEEARDDVGLNVELLDRHDPRWEAYWELYVRAEVYMQSMSSVEDQPVSKLFFDADSTLPAY
ncbi:MAG TPA: hypothetical protein VNV42_11800 [Solirubrobacteraceae bacterium]|jgi:hypothetical protein|nr:hypothetical protein [Solirubrobacteraceae bacterium]